MLSCSKLSSLAALSSQVTCKWSGCGNWLSKSILGLLFYSSPMNINAPDFRPALNALRGFAALYVVVYHLRHHSIFDWFGNYPLIRFGYMGVDFFFILSGLIISHVYLASAKDGNLLFWRKFIWLRLARLYPVHLLLMLLLLLVSLTGVPLHGKSQDYSDWITLTLLVRQWFMPDSFAWNGPAWSISVELFVYIFIFPIIAMVSRQFNNLWFGLFLLMAGSGIYTFLLFTHGTVHVVPTYGPLARVVAGFSIGAGLFMIVSRARTTINWNLMLSITALMFVPMMFLALNLFYSGILPDALMLLFVIVLICSTYNADGRLAQLLARRPLFWLGEISFSLYLCHEPIMRALSYNASWLGVYQGFWFGFVLVATSVTAAHFLYRYCEIPARDAMREWYVRRSERKAGKAISAVHV
jgi:peptidoglycan/LPS O-acetylase OafA/YrhL